MYIIFVQDNCYRTTQSLQPSLFSPSHQHHHPHTAQIPARAFISIAKDAAAAAVTAFTGATPLQDNQDRCMSESSKSVNIQ